ncbi:hypothetical protein ACXO2U_02310 [Lactobacillus delbrueckii subsp. bulgaricus]
MGKMVGLSRNLKMTWLNKAVELLYENLSEQGYKDKLNEYLSFEIKSPTNLRKTREILMNLWYYENPETESLRTQARALIEKDSDNSLAAHWCIILATYPIFVDVSRIIGKLYEFEEEFTIQQLKQKIFDEWGERATLFHSIDKIIATMKAMGALKAGKPGRYTIIKHEVQDDKVNALLASAGMTIEDKRSFTVQELRGMNYMFPFKYQIEREMLMMIDTFTITNIGGKMMVTLTERL